MKIVSNNYHIKELLVKKNQGQLFGFVKERSKLVQERLILTKDDKLMDFVSASNVNNILKTNIFFTTYY